MAAVEDRRTSDLIVMADDANTVFACDACKWVGPQEDLIVSEFEHDFQGPDDIMLTLMMDLRGMLAKTFATSFGAFLVKWGFVTMPIKPEHLGRYTAAVARAVLTAVLQERAQIEKEMRRGN